ncbi:kinetochore protein spc25 [Plakobranchus ocellatus]|uniref:Kinetochore protein SPC25 n=1 Tax=Plakobranchus ocellatus TaxID=259542 RepID=A0AAV4DCL9_9GAST|nr:kinetochore protein spc25 [Plakobranchus ocellatus]
MEALLERLHQSQDKIGKTLSELPLILKDKKKEDSIDVYQKKVQKYETACESRAKQQELENVSNQQQVKQRQCEAELLQVKKEAETKLISSLQEELSHLQDEQATFKKGPPPNSSEEKAKQLEAEETLFKQFMATEIEKVQGGWLQVVFTQIDPDKPSSKFFFLFKLDERRKYVVGDCQPPVHDMEMLVKRLNHTNNLSQFVHSVRKRFKQAVDK